MQMTKASRRVGLDALADGLHDLKIDAEQVVAAHAGLARHAGGDDAHVGAGDVGIVIGALQLRIETLDRARLHQVERLAARRIGGDVEQHRVAQLLQPDKMRERPADHSSADKCDLVACHEDACPLFQKLSVVGPR